MERLALEGQVSLGTGDGPWGIVCHCSDASHDSFLLIDGVLAVTRKMGDDVHVVNLEGTGAVFVVGPMMGLSQEGAAGLRALGRSS